MYDEDVVDLRRLVLPFLLVVLVTISFTYGGATHNLTSLNFSTFGWKIKTSNSRFKLYGLPLR